MKKLTRILAILGAVSLCGCVSVWILATLSDDVDPDATSPASISQAPDPSATPAPIKEAKITDTPGPTPTPTITPVPTSTLTPIELACSGVRKALGDSNRKVTRLSSCQLADNGQIEIAWAINQGLTESWIGRGARMDITDMLKAIARNNVDYRTVEMQGTYSMIDKFGNASEELVLDVIYTKASVDRINFDNFLTDNVFDIATSSVVNPALRP